jgi:hypothetical protein
MEEKVKRPGRKKSPPRTKSDRKNPKAAEALSRLWADPVWAEKTKERMRLSAVKRKGNPAMSRLGVPDGMRRADAKKAWAKARKKAAKFMEEFEDQGVVVRVPVPESDDEKAKASLNEACVMALGPTDSRTKLAAIRTVLEFTKQKPTQKIDNALSGPEEWLKAAIKANGAAPANAGDQ